MKSAIPKPFGHRWFTDGANRPVYLDTDGRQFVLDDDGQRVYGVWILEEEADAPIMVLAQ